MHLCARTFMPFFFLHMTSSGLCSFNWIQAGKMSSFDRALHSKSMPNTNIDAFLFESFVFKMKRAHPISSWEFEDNHPVLTQHKSPERGYSPFCVYGQAAVMMRSGEACNLLGFHTNGIVEEPLLEKAPRSDSLWAGEADKGGGRQAGGGVEDEMEAGHKAECRQAGTTGSAGHFNLWIHCFPLCGWNPIFM